jgi:hypothetical protein
MERSWKWKQMQLETMILQLARPAVMQTEMTNADKTAGDDVGDDSGG